jgi:hypothetical protein
MRTLIDLQEKDDMLELIYAENYPVIIEGKLTYYGLEMISLTEDYPKIGIKTPEGVVELKLTKELVKFTDELKKKALNTNTWKEVTTESGQVMLFPPDLTK